MMLSGGPTKEQNKSVLTNSRSDAHLPQLDKRWPVYAEFYNGRYEDPREKSEKQ